MDCGVRSPGGTTCQLRPGRIPTRSSFSPNPPALHQGPPGLCSNTAAITLLIMVGTDDGGPGPEYDLCRYGDDCMDCALSVPSNRRMPPCAEDPRPRPPRPRHRRPRRRRHPRHHRCHHCGQAPRSSRRKMICTPYWTQPHQVTRLCSVMACTRLHPEACTGGTRARGGSRLTSQRVILLSPRPQPWGRNHRPSFGVGLDLRVMPGLRVTIAGLHLTRGCGHRLWIGVGSEVTIDSVTATNQTCGGNVIRLEPYVNATLINVNVTNTAPQARRLAYVLYCHFNSMSQFIAAPST